MEELEHVIRQNDSGTQKTKKSIQLIILKKITRIKYYQSCEVKLKKHKVCITPNGENDDDSVIKVKLSSNFIKYEYAIYFPEHDDDFGFALVFFHKRHCNYVFNSFQQQKVNNGNEDTQISDEMLENLFLKPLIKELHHYSTLKFDLRVFILRFLKSMDNEQKQRLAPLIIATKIDKSLIDSVLKGVDLGAAINQVQVKCQYYKVKKLIAKLNMKDIDAPNNVTTNDIECYDDNQTNIEPELNGRFRKRRNNNIDNSGADADYADIIELDASPSKKRERKSRTNSMKSEVAAPLQLNEFVYSPNFKVISYIQNGISKSRLFIFPTSDKTQCFEYFFDFNRKYYICCGCNNGKRTHAKSLQDSNGADYVHCFRTDHICKLRPFKPDKYKTDFIIKKPNYELNGVFDDLLLYTSADKKKFYKFTYDCHQKLYICMKCWTKKNYIQACVCYDENGEKYISVRNRKHICSKMNYLVSDQSTEIAAVPNFKHVVRNLNKKTPKKRVSKKKNQK
uniref:Uncharacterized protein n=1 Tax=Panagrolaimus sp. PS1159 TaxID=55785 RepID=A0AC35G7S0_9BILA